MKKIVSLILSLSMVFILSACSNKDDSADSADTKSSSSDIVYDSSTASTGSDIDYDYPTTSETDIATTTNSNNG